MRQMHAEELAMAMAGKHGPKKAKEICLNVGREFIGKEGNVPNPHRGFYMLALSVLNKRFPKTEEQTESAA